MATMTGKQLLEALEKKLSSINWMAQAEIVDGDRVLVVYEWSETYSLHWKAFAVGCNKYGAYPKRYHGYQFPSRARSNQWRLDTIKRGSYGYEMVELALEMLERTFSE